MEEVLRGGAPLAQSQAAGEAEAAGGRVLDRVREPADLKQLERHELHQLAHELRDYIVDVVASKGGHLGASLGVVELTVALHRVLELPRDRLVWDTGHQAYVHKVLTGRKEALWTIRQYGGISGFLKRDESPYDAFGAGHASTAISAALGMATARDLAGEDYRVVAVVGDGALTGGLAYEALNNAGQARRPMLVVLNDNGMSIGPNVGAIAHYLTRVSTSRHLRKMHEDVLALVRKLPAFGEPMEELARRLENALRDIFVPGALFQALGFKYYGPVDGHDLDLLLDLLPKLLERRRPTLLHVRTRKGKGLPPAERDHESFHGVAPFDKVTGKALEPATPGPPAFTKVFGEALVEAGARWPKLVAITAAMPSGTGLAAFHARYPERCFDVGIAEAHAVCFAAGLACEGMRPVVAIYSTFLQRAYDQIVHDVALQRLPVVFAVDRAGLVGADGPTHHGALDLAYLRCVPGMVVSAPWTGNELRDLLWTALHHEAGPFAIRYPRACVPAGFDPSRPPQVLPVGRWEVLQDGEELALLAVGAMVPVALAARERLARVGVRAAVVNCRFVKPLDGELLEQLRQRFDRIVTLEEGTRCGGFGDAVVHELVARGLEPRGLLCLGLPDRFVLHGSRDELLREVGLTPDSVAERVRAWLDG